MAEIQYQNYENWYNQKSSEYNDNHETIDYNELHRILNENKKNELLENAWLNDFDESLDVIYTQNNDSKIKKFKIQDLPLEDNSDLALPLLKIWWIWTGILWKYFGKFYDYIKNIFVKNEKVTKVEKTNLNKLENNELAWKMQETVGWTYSSEKMKNFVKELDKLWLSTKEKANYEILLKSKIETASLKLKDKWKLIETDKIIINWLEFTAENWKNWLFDIFAKLDWTKRKEILEALDKSWLDKKIYTILSLDSLKYWMDDILQNWSLSQAKILFRWNNIWNLDKKILNDITRDKIGQQKLDNILDIFDDLVEKTRNKQELIDVRDWLYQLNKSIKNNPLYYNKTNNIINNINLKLNK